MAAESESPASQKGNGSAKPKIKIQLGDMTHNNIKQLQTINSVVFPVKYNEKFYKDALDNGEFTKLAYINDVCIGGVVAKKEPVAGAANKTRLNIQTIAVLAPYRRLGVGKTLVDHLQSHSISDKRITELAVHVATTNEDALRFYEREGFAKLEEVKDYYREREVSPPDAWLLVKDISGLKENKA